jgi:DNA invertase Pin-like site-specific DNA recombinase
MPEANTKPTAHLYTRVSTYRQLRDGTSIPAQISQGKAYADYKKLDLGPQGKVTVGEYQFDAPERVYVDSSSAFKTPLFDRPEGRRLFVALRPGDHLIVAKLDRGFRDTVDCLTAVEKLRSLRVTFHLMDLQLDTSTPFGEFGLTVMAAVAKLESARRGERVREAYWARVHLTGQRKRKDARPGFVWVGKGRHKLLKSVPEEQATMWACWMLHCEGWGERQITSTLWAVRRYVPEVILKVSEYKRSDRQYSYMRVRQIVAMMEKIRDQIGERQEGEKLAREMREKLKHKNTNGRVKPREVD